jgi:hypothetical protein
MLRRFLDFASLQGRRLAVEHEHQLQRMLGHEARRAVEQTRQV